MTTGAQEAAEKDHCSHIGDCDKHETEEGIHDVFSSMPGTYRLRRMLLSPGASMDVCAVGLAAPSLATGAATPSPRTVLFSAPLFASETSLLLLAVSSVPAWVGARPRERLAASSIPGTEIAEMMPAPRVSPAAAIFRSLSLNFSGVGAGFGFPVATASLDLVFGAALVVFDAFSFAVLDAVASPPANHPKPSPRSDRRRTA